VNTLINLSIIIPVKNEAENLENCLRSICVAKREGISYEVIVVDNGSTDGTQNVAERFGAHLLVDSKLSVAGLRNYGATIAKGMVLCFIDADCTVEDDWFISSSPYLTGSDVKCFGNTPGIPKDSTWVQRCWYRVRKKESSQGKHNVQWLESMNLFIQRDTFNAVEGFDSTLTTCEDYDLCMRLKPHCTILSDPNIQIIHHGEAVNVKHFYQKERWRGVSNIEGIRSHGITMSEIPSLLFPLSQIAILSLVLISFLFVMIGWISLSWFVAGIFIWQIPIFLLSIRKSNDSNRFEQIFGIWTLLNVYFTARGQSLFMGAAWKRS